MDKFKKLEERVDYNILEASILVYCSCGNDVYISYDEPRECDFCGAIYDISLSVNEYERI